MIYLELCSKSSSLRINGFLPLSVAYFTEVEVSSTIPIAEGFI
jgi:hypothetical protein